MGIISMLMKHFNRRLYSPNINVDEGENLTRLGSSYGGWTFEDAPYLHGSTIISCGLGLDASFDVEFAARYDATVIIVDPTPRAIVHFDLIESSIGKEKTTPYISGGHQPISSYPLDRIRPTSLILERSALWVEATELRFFAPRNPSHVSHSIVNLQNNYSEEGPYIEVPAITILDLIVKYNLKNIPLLKLDIEGAEVDVIPFLVNSKILPTQILVEFDELALPSSRSKERAEKIDRLLRDAGYICKGKEGATNFLYVRDAASPDHN